MRNLSKNPSFLETLIEGLKGNLDFSGIIFGFSEMKSRFEGRLINI